MSFYPGQLQWVENERLKSENRKLLDSLRRSDDALRTAKGRFGLIADDFPEVGTLSVWIMDIDSVLGETRRSLGE